MRVGEDKKDAAVGDLQFSKAVVTGDDGLADPDGLIGEQGPGFGSPQDRDLPFGRDDARGISLEFLRRETAGGDRRGEQGQDNPGLRWLEAHHGVAAAIGLCLTTNVSKRGGDLGVFNPAQASELGGCCLAGSGWGSALSTYNFETEGSYGDGV